MNIIELLDEYRIPHREEGHEHCRPGWSQVECPKCSPDSGRFRLGININHVYASCWTCGYVPIQSVLKTILGVRWDEAKKLLAGIKPERMEERIAHTGHYAEPDGVVPLLKPHKAYLRGRGFDCDELERLWHIRGIGIATRLSWRIFIPIIHHGKAVSWTTRKIAGDGERKYLSAAPSEETIEHKHLLYGEDYCRHAVVVVEGPFDVWGGGPGFGCTFGLSYTTEQVARIASYRIRAVAYDNEPEAQKVARELVGHLSAMPGETYNIVLDSKDPGEAKRKEIQRIRKEILE
jgi:hypothetical protein